VTTAIARARARHAKALGLKPGDPQPDITFADLLRVVHPRATAAEIAAVEAAAPPRLTPEQRLAAKAAERAKAALESAAAMRAAELDAVLALADADGSGELDLGEFCMLMTRLGVKERDEQLSLFEEADNDGSGAISVPEFREWWCVVAAGCCERSVLALTLACAALPSCAGATAYERCRRARAQQRLGALHAAARSPRRVRSA
jgi:hypothetical protein